MKKITKKLARAFAQEFFHTKKLKEMWSDDNVCYLLGPLQLEIFPSYGLHTGQNYPYGAVTLFGYQTGTVCFIDGEIEYESLAGGAIDLMHKLSQSLLRAVDEESINECNANKCIESNFMLFQAVQLAQEAEKF